MRQGSSRTSFNHQFLWAPAAGQWVGLSPLHSEAKLFFKLGSCKLLNSKVISNKLGFPFFLVCSFNRSDRRCHLAKRGVGNTTIGDIVMVL